MLCLHACVHEREKKGVYVRERERERKKVFMYMKECICILTFLGWLFALRGKGFHQIMITFCMKREGIGKNGGQPAL